MDVCESERPQGWQAFCGETQKKKGRRPSSGGWFAFGNAPAPVGGGGYTPAPGSPSQGFGGGEASYGGSAPNAPQVGSGARPGGPYSVLP